MPMPSMMPAAIVSSSAGSSMSLATPRTKLVKVSPTPVSAMTPMTMPAEAQASATMTESIAPASRLSTIMRSDELAPRRPAEQRRRHDRDDAQSAAKGAL